MKKGPLTQNGRASSSNQGDLLLFSPFLILLPCSLSSLFLPFFFSSFFCIYFSVAIKLFACLALSLSLLLLGVACVEGRGCCW